ncbi:MAG: hypothetical protein PHP31_08955 [Lentimicrobiaceae bacterium]|nr:hypothetical protein [Lentimicrobiaceae bacterium]
MQSIRRQIKRGNAVIALNNVTHNFEIIQKRGTDVESWKFALKHRDKKAEKDYIDKVTMPLSQKDIINGKTYISFNDFLKRKKAIKKIAKAPNYSNTTNESKVSNKKKTKQISFKNIISKVIKQIKTIIKKLWKY